MVGAETIGTRQLATLTGRSQRTARRWLASGVLTSLPAPRRAHHRVDLRALRARLDELQAERADDQADDPVAD